MLLAIALGWCLGVAFGEETFKRALKAKLVEALREELTSGDSNIRKLLPELVPLGELALIPAGFSAGREWVYGYARYSGGVFYSVSDSLSGGHWSSSTVGNWIEFEFYGTWFDVVFYAKSGVARIYVDGVLVATVNVSNLKGPYRNVMWRGPRDLSDDYHTVRVEVASGTVQVAGIVVDPARNPWRIIPFPYDLYYNLYYLYYYGTYTTGLYVRSSSTSHPVFAEKWPAYRTAVSTTTALAAGGVWTSASVDCFGARPYAKRIYVTLYSDVGGTLYIEYSPNNVNWDSVESFSYTGGTTPVIGPVEVKGRYARLRYVNNPTVAQTVFRLYAWFMGE